VVISLIAQKKNVKGIQSGVTPLSYGKHFAITMEPRDKTV
jgi:hypothetical protein